MRDIKQANAIIKNCEFKRIGKEPLTEHETERQNSSTGEFYGAGSKEERGEPVDR